MNGFTITVTVSDIEISLKLYRAATGVSGRDKIRFRVLRSRIEKTGKRGFIPSSLRFSAQQIYRAFQLDSCLVPHGHVRSPVELPGKIENAILPDSGSERPRSSVPLPADESTNPIIPLSAESNSQQTAQWLRKNSFGNYVSTFANFSGADILRLTRDDLIQICGLADGIRLLYALHSKAIVRLTLYICTPSSAVYHAVYLDSMGRNEMSRKLAKLLGVQQNHIHDIFLQGPNDIRVLVTDEVIGNIKDESMFSIEVLKDESRNRFVLLLKPASSTST